MTLAAWRKAEDIYHRLGSDPYIDKCPAVWMLTQILFTVPQLPDLRNHLGKLILPAAFWCWTGKGIWKGKRFKLNWTDVLINFKFEWVPILNFNIAINIGSKLFPVVHVKVIHLSPVFRKKGFVCQFLLSSSFEYQVIPSQIFMRNMCVSICI